MADRLKKAVTDVRDRIATLMNGADPLFPTISLFNNQIDREQSGQGYVVAKPAVFIEPQFENTERLGLGITKHDIVWRLHIVHEELDNEEGSLDANYNVIAYRDKIKSVLTLFKPSYCSQLFYENEDQDFDHNNIYHYILEMRSAFIDTKGSPYDPDSTQWTTGYANTLQITAGFSEAQQKIIVVNGAGAATTTPVQEVVNTVTGDWLFVIPPGKMLAIVVAIPEANGNISMGISGTGSDDILPDTPLTSGLPMVVNIYHYPVTEGHLYITSDVTVQYKIYYF